MFNRLKLITFDAKDTIIAMKKSAGRLYAEVAGIYGITMQEKDIHRMESSFGSCFNQVNTEFPNYGNTSRDNSSRIGSGDSQAVSLLKWWSMVIEKTFRAADFDESKLPADVLNQICIHSFKSFATSQCWTVKGSALQDLTKIKSLRPDVKMAVVSNGDQRLEVLLVDLGLRHLFDFVIDSHTYKCEKPSKGIFDVALQKSGIVDPSTALHVGDDVVTDYNGAINAGWNALLLTDEDKKANFEGKVDENKIITRIEQLIEK